MGVAIMRQKKGVNNMIDTNKFKKVLKESGYTVEKLAEAIGTSKSTIYRKLKNTGFTIKEADDIVKTLNLNPKIATEIFFNQFVA